MFSAKNPYSKSEIKMLNPTFKQTKIACYIGYVVQAIVINIAPLFFVIFSDTYGIDNAKLGTLVLLNFVIQIFTDITSVKLTTKLSIKSCAVLSQVFSFTGLAFLGILPLIIQNTYLALIIATFFYSVGGGLVEVIISPIIDAIPIEKTEGMSGAKAAAMIFLHSFYCWGQVLVVLVSTLILAVIGNRVWYLIPVLWSLVPLFNALLFLKVPFPEFASAEKRTPIKKIVFSRLFLLGAILMVCGGAAELAVAQWASMLAEKGLGISKVAGDLLGPCAFAFCMGIGRILYGILGTRFHIAKGLLGCAFLCLISYAMITLSASPVIALIGCSLCGFSVSLMWPGILSLAAREFPFGGTTLFGLLAIYGDLGCSLGPYLTGLVSDAVNIERVSAYPIFKGLDLNLVSMKCGLMAAAVFPILMIVTLVVFSVVRKSKNKKAFLVEEGVKAKP